MRRLTVLAMAAGALMSWMGRAADSSPIPDRPEKLKFPPLTYTPPDPRQFRVELKSGPVAYIVPDHELPLINIQIIVRCGDYVVPRGKEGLAGLAGSLMTRGGSKSKSADELEERLDFLAASLSSSVGDSQGSVHLNLLSKDIDEGMAILRDVMTEPRFEEAKLALHKQQSIQSMRERNDNSASIENRERSRLAYGDDFWVNQLPTLASIQSITQADLKAFHRRWFAPLNFTVAVSGDIDREKMVARLETLFSNWPFPGELAPAIPTNTVFAKPGVYLVNKDVNQGRVDVQLPGLLRDDPDYFAAVLMNDVLGGGGFTSHIVNRVRSDEGLAYSAGSSMRGGVYFPLPWIASFQSKSSTVSYALALIDEESRNLLKDGITDQELAMSKQGFIERLPRNFATKADVAVVFAQDEFTGRFKKDPDYWKNYHARIDAVTREDVARVAKRLLVDDTAVVLIVGQKDQILKGHPNHPVDLSQLFGGPIHDVPLRDPMTLKP